MTSPNRGLLSGGTLSTWAVIGGVFVAGLLGGAAVRSMVFAGSEGPRLSGGEEVQPTNRPDRRGDGRRGGSFDGSERFVGYLEKELGLSAEQATSIGAILDERERETDALFESISKPMRETLKRTEAEIREVLDDAQRVKFDEVVRDGRRRFGNGSLRGGRDGSRSRPDGARPSERPDSANR